jgi:hypothetical protein
MLTKVNAPARGGRTRYRVGSTSRSTYGSSIALEVVLACQNHTTHTNMSSGFGLTGGTSMRKRECAGTEREQDSTRQSAIGTRSQHANYTGSRKQVPHDAFPSGRMC